MPKVFKNGTPKLCTMIATPLIAMVLSAIIALVNPTSVFASNACSDVIAPLPAWLTNAVAANKSFYLSASGTTGVPWEMLAAIHYRETNFSHTNPGNGQGIFQFVNGEGGPYPPGPVSDAEFTRQLTFMANRIQSDYVFRGSLNYARRALTTSESDEFRIQDTLFSYNGRSSQYAQQAALYNFNPTTQPYQGSPYVMNMFDCLRANMGIITRDYGSIDSQDTRYGAFTIYMRLKGDSVWQQSASWLGNSLGGLIRTAGSNDLYLIDGQNRFTVPSMDLVAQYGLGMKDVRYVSDAYINTIPIASTPFSSSLGQIVKSDSDTDADGGALYLISNGYRIPIQTMDQFANFGFNTSSIHYLPLSVITSLPLSAKPLSSFIQAPDKSVYFIESGEKRAVFELSKLAQANTGGNVTVLSSYTISQWPSGAPLVDGDFLIIGPDSGVRLYSGSTYYSLPSMNIYECWGMAKLAAFRITSYATIGGSASGSLSSCVGKDSANNYYLMDGSKRYKLVDSQNVVAFSPSTSLVEKQDSSIRPVLKSSSSSELSVLENNILRPIPSMNVYTNLGYGQNDISTISSGTYASLKKGPRKLSIGSLLLEQSGGISVISSATTRRSVVSVRQFEDYSYQWSNLIPATATDLSAYTKDGNLSNYTKVGSQVFLVDGKVRYIIPGSIDEAIGINRDTVQINDVKLISNTLSWQLTRFIKSQTTADVYILEDGKKRPLASWQTFLRESGNRPQDLVVLTPAAVAQFPLGAMLH